MEVLRIIANMYTNDIDTALSIYRKWKLVDHVECNNECSDDGPRGLGDAILEGLRRLLMT